MIFYKSKKNRRVVVDVVVVVVSASGVVLTTKGVRGQKKNRLQKKRGRGKGGGDEKGTSRFLFFFRQITIKKHKKNSPKLVLCNLVIFARYRFRLRMSSKHKRKEKNDSVIYKVTSPPTLVINFDLLSHFTYRIT